MLTTMDSSYTWLPDSLLLAAAAAGGLYDLMAPAAPAPQPAAPALRGVAAGRVAKRRPRASRRLPTTYISADPANFRRMVQEVTGAGETAEAPAGAASPAALPRPVPSWGAVAGGLLLPTLDTSAFLLDRVGQDGSEVAQQCGSVGLVGLDGPVGPGSEVEGRGAHSFFPTLESWQAM